MRKNFGFVFWNFAILCKVVALRQTSLLINPAFIQGKIPKKCMRKSPIFKVIKQENKITCAIYKQKETFFLLILFQWISPLHVSKRQSIHNQQTVTVYAAYRVTVCWVWMDNLFETCRGLIIEISKEEKCILLVIYWASTSRCTVKKVWKK